MGSRRRGAAQPNHLGTTQGDWEQQGGRAGFLDGPLGVAVEEQKPYLQPVKDGELARRLIDQSPLPSRRRRLPVLRETAAAD